MKGYESATLAQQPHGRLREARGMLGLSASEAVEQSGGRFSVSHLYRLERGSSDTHIRPYANWLAEKLDADRNGEETAGAEDQLRAMREEIARLRAEVREALDRDPFTIVPMDLGGGSYLAAGTLQILFKALNDKAIGERFLNEVVKPWSAEVGVAKVAGAGPEEFKGQVNNAIDRIEEWFNAMGLPLFPEED